MDLASNNLQRSIRHKTKVNQIKLFIYIYIYISDEFFIPIAISLMSRVFANGLGDRGSITG